MDLWAYWAGAGSTGSSACCGGGAIKAIGEYNVEVALHHDVVVEIQLVVNAEA